MSKMPKSMRQSSDIAARMATPRKLDLRSIFDLQDEVIRSQIKHGPTAMLNVPAVPETLAYRMGILIEEVGEVGKAICEKRTSQEIEAELIQVGAMALSMAEAMRRKREAESDGIITEH